MKFQFDIKEIAVLGLLIIASGGGVKRDQKYPLECRLLSIDLNTSRPMTQRDFLNFKDYTSLISGDEYIIKRACEAAPRIAKSKYDGNIRVYLKEDGCEPWVISHGGFGYHGNEYFQLTKAQIKKFGADIRRIQAYE